MVPSTKPDKLPLTDLQFDRQNPRLAEYDITPSSTDEDILSVLWEAMDVQELVQSIAASGYFSHEPLIVAQEKGKYVVIEGNRRLAALKALVNPTVAQKKGWNVPILAKKQLQSLEILPVIHTNREEAWRYLGFKHVNGPAKWSSYAKAAYIAEVHRTFQISLENIANQIGDRHKTVQRLYRGLMVLEQAERMKVYDRDDRFRQRFAFSHLYTGLDYDGIGSFISLASENAESINPVPKAKLKELGELCVWLYGNKKTNTPPVVESQNPHLRQLDAVLKDREAVAALRSGTDLAKAFEISRPASSVFEEALLAAKRDLTTARGHLTGGYDKSEALLRIAGTIAEMADDIYSEMDRKRNPGKKKRVTEE
ncbi:MAG: ParB/RepB/Spo0J family partition protein [Planctomycetaceae bacterium]